MKKDLKTDNPLCKAPCTKPKRVAWNYGKRKPEPDQYGDLWCSCLQPKLVSNSGGRGQAYCLLCHTAWYH
jgi:hypothetical protein